MLFIRDLFLGALFVGALGLAFVGGYEARRSAARHEAPAEQPPAEVLRRLEIRLRADLDDGHRGDRYRLFECREVPRGK